MNSGAMGEDFQEVSLRRMDFAIKVKKMRDDKKARESLDPANEPMLEMTKIRILLDKFFENGSEDFADPTIGRDKN